MNPITIFDKCKIIPPHISHEEGIRMKNIAEIAVHMLGDDLVQDDRLIVEEFEVMMELPYESLHILNRVAIGQDGIVGKWLFKTSLHSDFLLAHVAIQRPQFVVVTGTRVFLLALLLQGELPLAGHTLDSIHHCQVMVPWKDPNIRCNIALILIDLPDLGLGMLVEPQQHLEPIRDKLIALLRSDEVALIGQVPDILGVVLLIDLPIHRRAILWPPVEETLGEVSKAVVDELAGIASDVDYPLQVFEQDEGSVQVNSTVPAYQGQAVDVTEGGRIPDQLEVVERVLDLIQGLLVQVLVAVGQSDHIDLPPRFLGDSPHILHADLRSYGGLLQSRVVEQPNDLGKSDPLLVSRVGKECLLIFFDEGKTTFGEEESLIDGPVPNGLPPSIPHLLEEAVHSLEGKHAYDVPDRPVVRRILLHSVPGKRFKLSGFSPEEIEMHVWAVIAADEAEPIIVNCKLSV